MLLVESSGILLWEASEALENVATVREVNGPWARWLAGLDGRTVSEDRCYLSPAMAEIGMANLLRSASAPYRTLFYATPSRVVVEAGRLDAVVVTTKAGERHLRAHRWVDATERGTLCRLLGYEGGRGPAVLLRSMVLQTVDPAALDEALDTVEIERMGVEWMDSARPGERRLSWKVNETPWHRMVPELMSRLRELLSGQPPERTIVSHCAMRDYPVYASSVVGRRPSCLPDNLRVLSPELVARPFETLEDRYNFGHDHAWFGDAPALAANGVGSRELRELPEHDVVVAGTGTAGAIAALSSARAGARTLAIDAAPFPGGVGTGGGINGYFYGASGGLQNEVNARSAELTALLGGKPVVGENGWHHDAKKIALLELMEAAGVRFAGRVSIMHAEADGGGRVRAVRGVCDGRVLEILAKAFIDATGDGDLCVSCGAGYVEGRPIDGRTLAYSQSVFQLVRHDDLIGVRACNFDAGWVDATSAEDLTRARLEGVAQHLETIGDDDAVPLAVAPILGLRQSRQIHTDYTLTLDDLVSHRMFADTVGETSTVADTHSVDFEFESDRMAFYYFVCKGFWEPLHCQLPYRMLLPKGLGNVWIACRAAGIQVEASYGMRMQRDMQRLGEAAGLAAAESARLGVSSRLVDVRGLQERLGVGSSAESPAVDEGARARWLAELDRGEPGMHLWQMFHDDVVRLRVMRRLGAAQPRVSFYAAAVAAMWGEVAAEPRLLEALAAREAGPPPEEHAVRGAWGQCIDYPFWLLAVLLLRRCGGEACVPALHRLAGEPGLPLNVLTVLGCTLERLCARLGSRPLLVDSLDRLLVAARRTPSLLPPSRSLWHELQGQPQMRLYNDCGADTRQDHSWQIHLLVARARRSLGLPPQRDARAFCEDPRGFVRNAFVPLFSDSPAGSLLAAPTTACPA